MIEREVGTLDQRGAIAAVGGEARHADRFRDRQRALLGLDYDLRDLDANALGDCLRLRDIDAVEDARELLAAVARRDMHLSRHFLKHLRGAARAAAGPRSATGTCGDSSGR